MLEPKKVPMKNHPCGGAVNLQTLATKLLGGGGKTVGEGVAKETSMKKWSAWTLADGQFHYTRLLLPVTLPRLFYTCLRQANSTINRAHLWGRSLREMSPALSVVWGSSPESNGG